ncbi:hypothetical protein [Kitasatospora aureofaciens]|uniref:hypothetical protein n=1 Tax=Kitasatospora aureofaciens TaxID=1894 RepID=UPI000526474C|nr:hypothetical protein [Kitasatospora aureofaciens]
MTLSVDQYHRDQRYNAELLSLMKGRFNLGKDWSARYLTALTLAGMIKALLPESAFPAFVQAAIDAAVEAQEPERIFSWSYGNFLDRELRRGPLGDLTDQPESTVLAWRLTAVLHDILEGPGFMVFARCLLEAEEANAEPVG